MKTFNGGTAVTGGMPAGALVFLVIFASLLSLDAQIYTLADLGPDQFSTLEINNSGQVISSGGPLLYQPATGWTNLSSVVGSSAYFTGINDAGQIVGVFGSYNDSFVYTPGKSLIDLNAAYLISSSIITCIDDAGAVGFNWGGDLLYGIPVSFTNLGDFDFWDYSVFYDKIAGINNAGQAAIQVRLNESVFRAYLYTPGSGTLDLGSLGSGGSSVPEAINSSGWVVGNSSYEYYANGKGFLYTPASGLIDVGSLNGFSYADAHAINNRGQVVGFAATYYTSHAMIYTIAAGMLDLNSLVAAPGWTLTDAYSINDQGQIVGIGTNPAGQQEAYLLTPVQAGPNGSKFLSELVSANFLITTLGGLTAGQTVVLQSSPDLKSWLPVQTNTATGNTMLFTNALPGPNGNFFLRALVQ